MAHLSCLGNSKAEAINIAVQINVGWSHPQGKVEKHEIEEGMKKVKAGKVFSIDIMTAEILKYGGGVCSCGVMLWICN